jgi:hypothetical protein
LPAPKRKLNLHAAISEDHMRNAPGVAACIAFAGGGKSRD